MTPITQLHSAPTFEQLRERWPVARRGNRQRAQRLWDEITSDEGCHTTTKFADAGHFEPAYWKATAQQLYDGMREYLESCRMRDSYKYEYLCELDTALNKGKWERYV